MPNWCNNSITITGPSSELKRFYEENKGINPEGEKSELLFSKALPEPFKTDEIDPSTGKEFDWWNWRINNWGTKWETLDVQFDIDETQLWYNFDTAWSPPEHWFMKVVGLYPELNFYMTFEEPGMAFKGSAQRTKGKLPYFKYRDMTDKEMNKCLGVDG